MKKSMSALAALAALILVTACGGGGGGAEDDGSDRTTPANLKRNEWISIPGGDYTVGDDRFVNFPSKKLKVDPFEIQKFEVTNHEYKAWLDKLPADKRAEHTPKEHFTDKGTWKNGWYPKGQENHPVVNVSYYDAKAYAEANGWRLPRRSEWEAAARGNDANLYPWGDSFDKSKCNFDSDDTMPVGSFPSGASPFGVMDMAGNVWEWLKEPFDKTQKAFLLKGGSYKDNDENSALSPNQLAAPRDDTQPTQGFRCVR